MKKDICISKRENYERYEKSTNMHKSLIEKHSKLALHSHDYNTIKKHRILMEYHRKVYNEQRRWGVILSTKEKKKEFKKAERII